MILRKSEFAQKATFDDVISWAEGAKGADRNNYRAEFVKMVKSTKLLAKDLLPVAEK
jgi:Ca-activated chloride channel family protein